MRRQLTSFAAATLLLAFSVRVVSADALVADGEGLVPIAGSRMDLGTICHAEPTTETALIAVRATGHPNNRQVFDNGATVTTTATVLAGTGLVATSAAPAVVMAADWRSQPNGTFAAPVAWDVSVTPDTLGRYRGRIEFTASGLNRLGQTITRIARMNVIARVVDCAPPVLTDVPADVVLEAVAPDGADVVYVPPTATDIVDGAVGVVCDVASGSRAPLGVTTVTCSATDMSGNVATSSFGVTVVDTTAPTLRGMPTALDAFAGDGGVAAVEWPMPSASDIVDGPLPVTCDPYPATMFSIGSTTVTCSASDAAGNVATGSFVIVVTPAPPDEPVEPPGTTAPDADDDRPLGNQAGGGPAAEGSATGVLPDTSMSDVSASLPVLGLLMIAWAAVAASRRRQAAGATVPSLRRRAGGTGRSLPGSAHRACPRR
jgi:HYR domain